MARSFKYKDWQNCIEKTCGETEILNLADQVLIHNMNEELNAYDSVTKYTPDDFKAGFATGIATITGFFSGVFGKITGG